MRLKEIVQDGIDVFVLEGEIDFHFAPCFRALLQSKLKVQCPALVLDFAGVDFIDSRGIALVIEYLRDCAAYGGKVCLASLNPDVQPIIDMVRLETVMPIFGSVPQAIAALKNPPASPRAVV